MVDLLPGFLAAQETVGRQLSPSIFGPTSPNNFPLPDNLVTGLCARAITQAKQPGVLPIIDGVVVDTYDWGDLQPNPGALDSTALAGLIADLDWCAANVGQSGLQLQAILRAQCGFQAPAWVKTAVGTLAWATNHGVQSSWVPTPDNPLYAYLPGGIPVWWNPAYWAYYYNFHALLSSAVGGHPALAMVTMNLPCTEFSEPCLKQFGYDGNRQLAWNWSGGGGPWTVDKDSATFAAGWDAHAAHWTPYNVCTETAFNPAQEIFSKSGGTALGYRQSVVRTRTLEQTMTGKLGRLGMWANFSLVSPQTERGADYSSMYQGQIDARAQTAPFPQAIGYQSETLTKFQADYASDPASNLPDTCAMAASWGATRLELPVGCQNASAGVHQITPAISGPLNTQFYLNSAPLMSSSGGGAGGGTGTGGSGSGGSNMQPNIMIVPMENEGYDITNATTWPKASVLASHYAYKSQFYGLAHPSQPNYLHLVTGDNQGVTDDSLQHTLTATSIFDQLSAAGVPWEVYAEGLSLATNNYSDGQAAGGDVYIPRHNIISAFAAYNPTSAKVSDAGSTSSIGTATWPTLINDLNSSTYPHFVWFTPSAANQGHGTGSPYKDPTTGPWASTAQDADNFIDKFVTAVQATDWYADGGTIIFVWDEGAGGDTSSGFTTSPLTGSNGGGHTNLLVVSSAADAINGAVSGLMNAWGLLGDIQDAYGITTALGQSQGAWGSISSLITPFGGTGTGGGGGGGTGITPDGPVIGIAEAPYFLAGCVYGDGMTSSETKTMSSTQSVAIKRNNQPETHKVALQMVAACQIIGGTASIEAISSTAEKTHLTMPAGITIVLNGSGNAPAMLLNGSDAFGLSGSGTTWAASVPTGKQVRAFLAGLIQGEGSTSGKIMDDPLGTHVQFIQRLLFLSQAYDVPTTMKPTGYHALTVDHTSDFPKIQAYPFASYARCPGGTP